MLRSLRLFDLPVQIQATAKKLHVAFDGTLFLAENGSPLDVAPGCFTIVN